MVTVPGLFVVSMVSIFLLKSKFVFFLLIQSLKISLCGTYFQEMFFKTVSHSHCPVGENSKHF